MQKETLTNAVLSKAKELNLTPKFLLFTIRVLAEKPDATEYDVFKPYFDSLASDMEAAAKEQMKSSNKNRSQAGSEAFKVYSGDYTFNSDSYKITDSTSLEYLLKGKQELNLHHAAQGHLVEDQRKVYRLANRAKYEGANKDAVQIIKLLSPDLVEQAKTFIEMFNDIDLSSN